MAADHFNEFTEPCAECGVDTPHEVTIKLVENEEMISEAAAKYSREPHRVATCLSCGNSDSQRVNVG